MNKVIAYCKESYGELVNKVSWPTWKELQSSAIVVMVASLIIALVIWGMDMASKFVLNDIFYKNI
ncbi:MAG: preprotein translocase subunit SecE [Bacteroidetes bacterium]|nr:preprotein translocase subunit SecE [Bacteroidota bacterium]